MRIFIIDTYYPVFLQEHYRRNAGLEAAPHARQWRSLMDACFGTADFYSRNLGKLGHEAMESVANCEPLQRQWARENGIRIPWKIGGRRTGSIYMPWLKREWFGRILVEQVKAFRPDVVHIQDPEAIGAALMDAIRPHTRSIAGQIASPYSERVNFKKYDLMLSSFPHFVERFRQMGVRSEYFRLGFEPAILQRIGKREMHDTVFVGGMSPAHAERVGFFEEVARRTRLDWWGYGVEKLAPASPLRQSWRGEAWAMDMYERLQCAKIAVNRHINIAEDYANNMRLYEATGVGTLLLTDARKNLSELFEPGKEAVAYHSVEECVERIEYYLDHETERAAIARAGQERALREHTYFHRMQEYAAMVAKIIR